MSTNTITSYHQVSRDELASLSPDTGARIAVTTDDQSYEMYVSDGTKWIKLGNTRTDGIPYTFAATSTAPAVTVSHTPEYHFDAAQGAASTHMFSDLQGTSVNNGDKICEWRSLTGGHSLKQLDVSRQPYWSNAGSDPDGMYGVHMHDLGTGMSTIDKNNQQLTGDTVTFVVFKPTAENISDLIRDINHAHAEAPVGSSWDVRVVSSNHTAGANTDIQLFFHNSTRYFYYYMTQLAGTHLGGLPKSGEEEMIDGVGKLANWNDVFVNSRQLLLLVTRNGRRETRGFNEISYLNLNYTSHNKYHRPANQSPRMLDFYDRHGYDPKYDGFAIGSKFANKNPHCLINETVVFDNMLTYQDINSVASHLVAKWNIPNWYPYLPDVNTLDPKSLYIL